MRSPRFTTVPPIRPGEPLARYAARIGVHRNTVLKWKRLNRLPVAKPEEMLVERVRDTNDVATNAMLGGVLMNRIAEIEADFLVLNAQAGVKRRSLDEVQDRIEGLEREFRHLERKHVVLEKELQEMEEAKRALHVELAGLRDQRAMLAKATRDYRRASIMKDLEDPELRAAALAQLVPQVSEPQAESSSQQVAPPDPVGVLKKALGEVRVLTCAHLMEDPRAYAELYALFLSGKPVESALLDWAQSRAMSPDEIGFLGDAFREWKAAGIPAYLVERRRPPKPS